MQYINRVAYNGDDRGTRSWHVEQSPADREGSMFRVVLRDSAGGGYSRTYGYDPLEIPRSVRDSVAEAVLDRLDGYSLDGSQIDRTMERVDIQLTIDR